MAATATQRQGFLPIRGINKQKDALRDIRNYLAGQALGFTRDESLLDEVVKCAFCRTRMERKGNYPAIGATPEDIARQYRKTYKEILGEFPELFDSDSELLLGPQHLHFIDQCFATIDLADPSRDLIGDIYEAFVGSSARGQEGQFFTPKNAVQLLVGMTEPTSEDIFIDPACGAGSFLLEVSRFVSKAGNKKIPETHGVDKDEYLTRLAKLHLALHFGDRAHIQCADSLAWSGNGIDESKTNKRVGKFTLILTNPPFGSRIVAADEETRTRFKLAHKWRMNTREQRYEPTAEVQNNAAPQVLFVERCLDLLGDGGRLGIVLPESMLCNPSHRYVMQYLMEAARIVAVVGMPESLFKISGKGGTHTKVCLLVATKSKSEQPYDIFMAEAKWCGHDSRGKEIPNDDLPEIANRFLKFEARKLKEISHLGFTVRSSKLRNLVLAPRYYDPEPLRALDALSESHAFVTVGDLEERGCLSISTGDEPGKLAYGTGDVPFVRTSDFSNWEIKLDPKHRVSHEYYQQVCAKQDVREGDILMVRDGTYLIGTCALVTKYDTEICYQSHIYKIRVNESAPFDSYFLLAAFSSDPVVSQIRAFSFTQDIIDTLGDRVRDLVIPVPKSQERREEVSRTVRKVIDDRIEARELARRARKLVVEP